MLAKYDRNHNGRLDADEKEAALADPLFIESEIDTIDANHNNVLDLDELAWFDANTNRILDPNEQAGITVAQRLLKRRFLKRFDLNGDGYIDQAEYDEFVGLPRDMVVRGPRVEHLPGATPDGRIEIDKLASLGDRWLLTQLRSYRLEEGLASQGKAGGTNAAPDPGPLLKLAVEAYWRDPASVTNAPLFPHAPPAPNRLPPGSSNADKAVGSN
jgi:hypothetical protein